MTVTTVFSSRLFLTRIWLISPVSLNLGPSSLAHAYQGDMDKGLVLCGQNAYRLNKIVPVKELIAELRAEIEAY